VHIISKVCYCSANLSIVILIFILFCIAHPIILNYCPSFKFYSCILFIYFLLIILCELMVVTDRHIVFSDIVTILAYVVSN